jgi:Flp pilus assembly pilin Flp
MQNTFKRICFSQAGVSVTEFGLIAPVVMVLIMGTLDIGHELYVKTLLNGAMQEMGRNSSLEGATITSEQIAIDNKLTTIVENLIPGATLYCEGSSTLTPPPLPHVCVTRRYYKTFSEAASAQAEAVIEDPNDANGRCDTGETFMDANENEIWDEDGGRSGQGGARDVVIITVNVKYDRLFPTAKIVGYGNQVALVSDSVIANQPYGTQTLYAPPEAVACP